MKYVNTWWILPLLFLAACTAPAMDNTDEMKDVKDEMMEEDSVDESLDEETLAQKETMLPSWFSTELTDVRTGETYTLNDFKGERVVVEAFAVWCPKCTAQQKTIMDIRSQGEDDVIHVNLNLDPSEDEDKVRSHIESNGFDWYYSVAPSSMGQALVESFGAGVASAPTIPMWIICEDQSFEFLDRGQKSKADIDEAFGKCSA
jgi:thiol-disulfide isomerase/thioredoxin